MWGLGSMKFKYKKYSEDILRPVIPIEITANNVTVPYEVLVDSGADICIFDAQIADILNIDLKKGQRKEVAGITGKIEFYYLYPVVMNLAGKKHQIEVGFLPNIASLGYGVVGQRGFFDLFVVKFDLVEREIELTPRK